MVVSTISVNYYRCIFLSQQPSHERYCSGVVPLGGTEGCIVGSLYHRYLPAIKLSKQISICVFLCLVQFFVNCIIYEKYFRSIKEMQMRSLIVILSNISILPNR